jgi:hypothetical protein
MYIKGEKRAVLLPFNYIEINSNKLLRPTYSIIALGRPFTIYKEIKSMHSDKL